MICLHGGISWWMVCTRSQDGYSKFCIDSTVEPLMLCSLRAPVKGKYSSTDITVLGFGMFQVLLKRLRSVLLLLFS